MIEHLVKHNFRKTELIKNNNTNPQSKKKSVDNNENNNNNYEVGAETTISKQYSKIKTTIMVDITAIMYYIDKLG